MRQGIRQGNFSNHGGTENTEFFYLPLCPLCLRGVFRILTKIILEHSSPLCRMVGIQGGCWKTGLFLPLPMIRF